MAAPKKLPFPFRSFQNGSQNDYRDVAVWLFSFFRKRRQFEFRQVAEGRELILSDGNYRGIRQLGNPKIHGVYVGIAFDYAEELSYCTPHRGVSINILLIRLSLWQHDPLRALLNDVKIIVDRNADWIGH